TSQRATGIGGQAPQPCFHASKAHPKGSGGLTWDRGKELSGHAQFALGTGTKVFFADPHSPWQRPTNDNTNGLLRQYFPKGTDLSRWSAEDLEAVALAINNRPRKILGWKTPAEVFEEQLRSLLQPGVATTG
ncbi:IS30 family transposase, partial [Streptomyces sp. NPDC048362]|uniref:IS30 family transposase n=1 Tax=Streptomyces sp. NPDC048362 TaxID=3365539 RepID=UPI003717A5CF